MLCNKVLQIILMMTKDRLYKHQQMHPKNSLLGKKYLLHPLAAEPLMTPTTQSINSSDSSMYLNGLGFQKGDNYKNERKA